MKSLKWTYFCLIFQDIACLIVCLILEREEFLAKVKWGAYFRRSEFRMRQYKDEESRVRSGRSYGVKTDDS